jgi:putative ABC transport system permease protein
VLGGLLAYFAFNGFQTSTMNWRTFSQVAFAFAVTPSLLVQGVAYALIMGFIGGLLPAVKAARLPISSALREL